MANELDEMNSEVMTEGHDAHVIAKQIEVKTDWLSTVFQVAMWILIIPGIVLFFKKIKAKSYLQQLQQKVNRAASSIDSYQTNRVVILQNLARLVDKATDLDKSVFSDVAKFRGGYPSSSTVSDAERNDLGNQLDTVSRNINVAFEAYPEIKAHKEIADAIQQNNYTQREITAAREAYNDVVNQWNTAIFEWPVKMIVAAENHYTTRIPYIASAETKAKSESVLF